MTVAPVPASGVRPFSGPVAIRLAMGCFVLALGASLSTCRLDKLIKPAIADRLAANPMAVQDSANIGSTTARVVTLQITSADGAALTWSATKDSAWVTLSKSSGGAPDNLVVTLHPDALSNGVHADTIDFTSPEAVNDPINVPVVFAILQPVLSVLPDTIVDTALQGETTGRVRTLTIANAGRGTLEWAAAGDAPWIGVNPPAATSPGPLTVTLDPTGLGVGTHSGRVVVTLLDATGSPDTTTVSLTITPSPVLSVSPTEKLDTAFQGSAVARTFTLLIDNTGSDNLAWTAVSSSPWLTLSKASGAAPPQDTIVVTLTPGSLAVGTYDGTITVTAPGAVGSPATVPVSFTIKPCAEPGVVPDSVVTGSIALSDCGAPQRPGRQAKLYAVQATAGDTLSFRLTSNAFDAYLILTNSSGTAVLGENDECGAEVGTACIKDFVVSTTGRYLVEATTANPGETGAFTLSAVKELSPSLPQGILQFRGDSTTAVGVGATTTEDLIVIKGTLNDLNPGDSVRLEIEMVETSSPFSGSPNHQSAYVGVGQTAWIRVPGLTENAGYHWRAKTCDKTLRCSDWLDFGNPDPAADFYVNAVPENPPVPTSIGQFKADATTVIAIGGNSNGSSVVLKGTVSDPDPGDQVSLEVEAVTVGTSFSNTATDASALGPPNRIAAATGPATLLFSYHWQVRTCDQTGRCSAWVSFPQPTPNPESSADYVGSL